MIHRLVAQTISQQLSQAVGAATAPFQYALSTRAGCECVAHTLQGSTELNPRATVVSMDGISAHHQISRAAMLSGLLDVEGGGQALPFVRMFYGSPSSYSWDDSCFSHNQAGGRRRIGRCADALVVRFGPTQGSRDNSVRVARRRLLVRTTFTRWCLLTELVRCTLQCNNICGRIVESECTLARRRCGTRKASDPQLATSWNVSLWQQTQQHGCGEDQAARKSWALRWTSIIRRGPFAEEVDRSSGRFWSGFLRCRICSQRGHCWFTALRREQIISCGLSSHSQWRIMREPTMMACGGASVASCALTSCRRNTSAAQRACFSSWAVWDCVAQFD